MIDINTTMNFINSTLSSIHSNLTTNTTKRNYNTRIDDAIAIATGVLCTLSVLACCCAYIRTKCGKDAKNKGTDNNECSPIYNPNSRSTIVNMNEVYKNNPPYSLGDFA